MHLSRKEDQNPTHRGLNSFNNILPISLGGDYFDSAFAYFFVIGFL